MTMRPRDRSPGLAVLILARDEADILRQTLPRILADLGPGDRLHVVADHCRDGTAAVARRSGATVHVRNGRHGAAGKGESLRWWLERTASTRDGGLPVIVLDADSLPGRGFFQAMRRHLARGASAVQAVIEPGLPGPSIVTQWAAFSEIVEQRVFDRARTTLGWPVRLRGTGMGFARPILEGASQGLSTTVEDVELTLILGAQGVAASLATDTWVCDPKPPDVAGVIRQRARWLRGQFQAALAHRAEVARLVLRGPAGWGLLSSVLLKPKAFFLPLKALVVAAGWLAWKGTHANAWIALSGFAAASFAIDAGGLLWGLRWIDGWGARLRLLTAAPLYAWIWLRSLALSIVTRERWLRSRPVSTPAPAPELAGEP